MYIGIDLGTSNSSIAGIVDGKARVFRPADGGEVLPSIIYFDKRGHRLYGRRAHDQALVSPENVASGFKRLMGTSTAIEIKGVELTLSPEECSADIIRQLLEPAATETGNEKIEGAVIAIPAAFNQMQTEATLRAAKLAGLERVDLLQEPIAASLAAMEGSKRSGRFIVYDLGGGTFDVALVQAIDGEWLVIDNQCSKWRWRYHEPTPGVCAGMTISALKPPVCPAYQWSEALSPYRAMRRLRTLARPTPTLSLSRSSALARSPSGRRRSAPACRCFAIA